MHRSASGHTVGGWAWGIFTLAAIVTAAGVVLPRLRRPEPARAVVFGAALLGLLCFVFEANELARGVWTPFGRIQPQDIGVKPGLGARGTVVGFFLAIAGAFLMPGPRPRWLPAWRALTRRSTPVGSCPAAGHPVGSLPAAGRPVVGTPAAGASIEITSAEGASVGSTSAASPPPAVDPRGSPGARGEGTA